MLSEAAPGKVCIVNEDILTYTFSEAFPKHLSKNWEDGQYATNTNIKNTS